MAGINGFLAWVLGRKYTKDTAHSMGAVKGAPCTVQGTEYDADGNTVVTLGWKDSNNLSYTTKVTIKAGVSVKDAVIDETGHLIMTLSDGTVKDAGLVEGLSELTAPLTATVALGTITPGKTYPKGTSIETILRDALIKVEAPGTTLATTPSRAIYDVAEEQLETITLKATVTKKTHPVASVKFFIGDMLIEAQTTGVEAGGVFSCNYTPTNPIKETTTFKAVATDTEGNSAQSAVQISFVGKTYFGIVDPTTGEPTESEIKALGSTLKTVKGYVYKGIVCDFNKVVYAYPQTFGALSSIKDVDNNINYTGSFTRTSIKVDGIDYYCYTLNEPTGADGVDLTFA